MRRINFDHLSYSPILGQVREAMLPFLGEDAGISLSQHLFGEKPHAALERARSEVANLIGANPEEIIFTSCGSEANNLAIKGIAKAYIKKGKHIISTPIEHLSVLHPLKSLEKDGYEISWLPVDSQGMIDPNEVKKLIRPETTLISVTAASNEIGTIEPIRELGAIAKEKGIVLHADGVAVVGVMPIKVDELSVDLLSLSGNTFYGPCGIGALYVRRGIHLIPLIEGGIQENGLRAGAYNLSGIVGMGIAARLAQEEMLLRQEYLIKLREKLIAGLRDKIPEIFLTGHRTLRLPGHVSFCVKFIEGEAMTIHLNFLGLAASSGSTCSSQALKVSHVLKAIGIDPLWAQGSLVCTLGIENTEEDVDFFLTNFPPIVEKLRQLSPLVAKYHAPFATPQGLRKKI
ncbi:MAG: cysteine desulfurase family protein [Thermodesulfobacteriota bacterium]